MLLIAWKLQLVVSIAICESKKKWLNESRNGLTLSRWAIRNCGLMLFKALLRRLNGGTDTASTIVPSSHRQASSMVFARYPNLPDLILKLLYNGGQLSTYGVPGQPSGVKDSMNVNAQSVFAALEVIERSGIPLTHEAQFISALKSYMGGPDWTLREKAAKTLSMVIHYQDLDIEFDRLLSPDWQSQNVLHGRLLCVRYILRQTKSPLTGRLIGS